MAADVSYLNHHHHHSHDRDYSTPNSCACGGHRNSNSLPLTAVHSHNSSPPIVVPAANYSCAVAAKRQRNSRQALGSIFGFGGASKSTTLPLKAFSCPTGGSSSSVAMEDPFPVPSNGNHMYFLPRATSSMEQRNLESPSISKASFSDSSSSSEQFPCPSPFSPTLMQNSSSPEIGSFESLHTAPNSPQLQRASEAGRGWPQNGLLKSEEIRTHVSRALLRLNSYPNGARTHTLWGCGFSPVLLRALSLSRGEQLLAGKRNNVSSDIPVVSITIPSFSARLKTAPSSCGSTNYGSTNKNSSHTFATATDSARHMTATSSLSTYSECHQRNCESNSKHSMNSCKFNEPFIASGSRNDICNALTDNHNQSVAEFTTGEDEPAEAAVGEEVGVKVEGQGESFEEQIETIITCFQENTEEEEEEESEIESEEEEEEEDDKEENDEESSGSESDDEIEFSDEADSFDETTSEFPVPPPPQPLPCSQVSSTAREFQTFCSSESGFAETSPFGSSTDDEWEEEEEEGDSEGVSNLNESEETWKQFEEQALSFSPVVSPRCRLQPPTFPKPTCTQYSPITASPRTSQHCRPHPDSPCSPSTTANNRTHHHERSLLDRCPILDRLLKSRVCSSHHSSCCPKLPSSSFSSSSSSSCAHNYTNDSSSDTDCTTYPQNIRMKRVTFVKGSKLVEVHHIVAWQYAYRSCRKGPWEQYARERSHFRRKIDSLAEVIEPCLAKKLEHIASQT